MQTLSNQQDLLYSQLIGPVAPEDVTPGESVVYPSNSYGPQQQGYDYTGLITVIILISFLLGLIGAGIYFFLQLLKKKDRDRKSENGVLFEVKVPRENET